jgi:class 3 adenylate cyclase
VYVGESVADSVVGDRFQLTGNGAFELKGITEPVRIFRATRTDSSR